MCLTDNRIWERVIARQFTAITGGGVTTLVGSSPNRVGLVFGNDLSGETFVGPNPAVSAASGIIVNPLGDGSLIRVYWRDWGGALLQPWFGFSNAGASTISVTELTIPLDDWDFFIGTKDIKLLQRIG